MSAGYDQECARYGLCSECAKPLTKWEREAALQAHGVTYCSTCITIMAQIEDERAERDAVHRAKAMAALLAEELKRDNITAIIGDVVQYGVKISLDWAGDGVVYARKKSSVTKFIYQVARNYDCGETRTMINDAWMRAITPSTPAESSLVCSVCNDPVDWVNPDGECSACERDIDCLVGTQVQDTEDPFDNTPDALPGGGETQMKTKFKEGQTVITQVELLADGVSGVVPAGTEMTVASIEDHEGHTVYHLNSGELHIPAWEDELMTPKALVPAKPEEPAGSRVRTRTTVTANTETPKAARACTSCSRAVSAGVESFSRQKFGRVLCMDCQKSSSNKVSDEPVQGEEFLIGIAVSPKLEATGLVQARLDSCLVSWNQFTLVIREGAEGPGADAISWAEQCDQKIVRMAVPGDTHDAFLKNNVMVARGCHRLVAFWDGKPGGCLHTMLCAVALGKKVYDVLAKAQGRKVFDANDYTDLLNKVKREWINK